VTRFLSPLEVASGMVLAPSRPRALPRPAHGTTPRRAFEAAILPALRRGPCLVSFSGGRDSSAVLAVATALARAHGLADPVPVTHRFASADTHESDWQEQVVRHLGLTDWVRIEAGAELGCVGPVATAALLRHGLLWPCNAYFHAPLLDAARGGALLTGIGGDEAFSGSTWARPLAVLRGAARPHPRDALRVGFALAPAAVKRPLIRRRLPALAPWLRADAQRELRRAIAADAAREPVRWRARHRALLGAATMDACLASLEALATDRDVAIAHPFATAPFLAALAGLPRAQRHRTRTQAMADLVGDLLPDELICRSTKARFGDVFWTEPARELIASWTGDGVDHAIVDADRLREEWRSPAPAPHTVTLLQSVWLSRARAAAPPSAAATPARAAG
jgi:asparagine synthase (glutamine-hydrolysing)